MPDATNSMIFFKGLSIISENISKGGKDGTTLADQLSNSVWGGMMVLPTYYQFGLEGSVLTDIVATSIALFITRNKDKIHSTDTFIQDVFREFRGGNMTINNGVIEKHNVIRLIKKQIDIPEPCNSVEPSHIVIVLLLIILIYFIYKKYHTKISR
jgi:hypothetical protein